MKSKTGSIPMKDHTQSRHLKNLKKRLSKWVKDENRGHICVETITHPISNGKTIISIQQLRLDSENNRTKTVFQDLMVIHSDYLDLYINHLQEIRDSIQNEEITKTTIQNIDFNLCFNKLILAKVYAEILSLIYLKKSEEFCEGCFHQYQDKDDHACLSMSLTERLEMLFKIMLEEVDEREVSLKFSVRLKDHGSTAGQCILKEDLMKDNAWIHEVKKQVLEKLSSY